MSLTILKYLSVLDGRHEGWIEGLKEQLETGNNFFLIVPDAPQLLEELAQILEVHREQIPKSCDRKKPFSLIAFIDPKDFDAILAAQEADNLTCFIEQIDLPRTRPPRVKPFLVYCSIHGIVAQHDNPREARESCAGYMAAMSGLKNQREAAVYKWREREWYNTETC